LAKRNDLDIKNAKLIKTEIIVLYNCIGQNCNNLSKVKRFDFGELKG